MNTTTPTALVIMGRSGCGKGTQAKLLMDYLVATSPDQPILYIETGKSLRAFAAGEGHSEQLVKACMDTGARTPDFLAIWNWANQLVERFTGKEHIVIDGAPRSALEAAALFTAFSFYHSSQPIIIHLDVSAAWATERLVARGRGDDQELSDIQERLRWFDTEVAPAIAYFAANPACRVITVNGERPIETIHQDIVSQL
jgi:adenylate kinase family enzyme